MGFPMVSVSEDLITLNQGAAAIAIILFLLGGYLLISAAFLIDIESLKRFMARSGFALWAIAVMLAMLGAYFLISTLIAAVVACSALLVLAIPRAIKLAFGKS